MLKTVLRQFAAARGVNNNKMQIYLPIAEMAVPVEQIFSVSALVGFLSGMLGIGGGFLTTPFLIFIGIPPSIAVGTQATQLVASSTSGVFGYLKRGHVDVRMGALMLGGGFFGSLLGAWIFSILQSLGKIDFVISVMYIILLGSVGMMMVSDVVRSYFFKDVSLRREFNHFRPNPFIASLPFKVRFRRSSLYISAIMPISVGFVGGLLASVLGIGGGFILVPAMLYLIGMPGFLVAGTSLFQMIFTTAFAAIIHAVLNNTVDIVLAVILMIGGVIGAQIGVGFTRFVSGLSARILFAAIVLAVCAKMCFDFFIQPEELFSTMFYIGGGPL
jgi:uncharacterized membrane protein YfcA